MYDLFINGSGLPELIETTVLPTVGEDTDRQYVCITLQVIPTDGYPDVQPRFHLRNPRGLDDHSINAITIAVQEKLAEAIGMPVVFDLIEVIRERLTESNLPSGQCVVCLYGFQDGDEFTKTVCYHYLHSYCLARHLNASQRNFQEEQDKLPAWQRQLAKPFQVCVIETRTNSVINIYFCYLAMLPCLSGSSHQRHRANSSSKATARTAECSTFRGHERTENSTN